MRSAAFLDRDGVLNKLVVREGRTVSPRTLKEFELLPGVVRAVEALRRAGLRVVVVTNQPDVARGQLAPAELERMHARLRALLPVNAIYTCPHDDADGCLCRKPKPGLLLRAARELHIALKESWVVGDSWKDIEAGKAAACTTFLVQTPDLDPPRIAPNFLVSNLSVAVQTILREFRRSGNCVRQRWPEGLPSQVPFPRGGPN